MAGFPYTIPGKADFKKEYNFIWKLKLSEKFNNRYLGNKGYEVLSAGWGSSIFDGNGKFTLTSIFDPQYINYICQLCEKVEVPDDEFEMEELDYGPTVVKMPKRIEMHDITVTYLEDSLNSVYNFHKAWFSAIRSSGGINSPYLYSAQATYTTFDRTLSATEQLALRSIGDKYLNSGLSAIFNSDVGTSALTSMLGEELDPLTHVTGEQIYPFIYPTKISGRSGDKSSTGLSRTTVTYVRLPNVIPPSKKVSNPVTTATESVTEAIEPPVEIGGE